MLAERDMSFKHEHRREVLEMRHDGSGSSAQTLDATVDIALRTY